MDGQIYKQVNGCIDSCMDGQMDTCIGWITDKWIEVWMADE